MSSLHHLEPQIFEMVMKLLLIHVKKKHIKKILRATNIKEISYPSRIKICTPPSHFSLSLHIAFKHTGNTNHSAPCKSSQARTW
jgi:hypothetical protein